MIGETAFLSHPLSLNVLERAAIRRAEHLTLARQSPDPEDMADVERDMLAATRVILAEAGPELLEQIAVEANAKVQAPK